jgi:hypothetical protein
VVQVGCSGSPGEPNLGAANAGIAIATIIAAITRVTVNTKSMRLIAATSFHKGRGDQPRQLANAPTLAYSGTLFPPQLPSAAVALLSSSAFRLWAAGRI